MAKAKLVNVVTPVGELQYVNISGQGKENYNEDGYEYVATIILDGAKSENLRKSIDEVIGEMGKGESLKSTGYRQMEVDEEGNEYVPTSKRKGGTPIDKFAFGFRTSTVYKQEGKPDQPKVINVYNKDAKKINLGDKKIGNGSMGAISGKMSRVVYKSEVSCSLYINNIQLTNFIEYEGDAGFETQEGEFDGVTDTDSGFTGQPDADTSTPSSEEKAKSKVKPRL